MELTGLGAIADFFSQIDVFILIFIRVLAFFILVPVASGINIPNSVKIIVSVCIAAMIFSSGQVSTVVYENTIAGYVYLILIEVLTGIILGYTLFAIFNLLYFSGQLIDYQIGFSMVNVLNPMTQTQVPIVGNLYYLAITALLVVSGGFHAFINAFFYSYSILPVGSANILGNPMLAWYMLELMADFFIVAVKIALPIVGSILVIDAALGIMVKAVPQMNVFVVGMPIKLLMGLLLLLMVGVPSLVTIYNYVFDLAHEALINVIWGMALAP